MNFKEFLLIFALSIFLSKYPPIFLIYPSNPNTDISIIIDILFLGSNISVLKQHYEYKLLELEEEKKVRR